MAMLSLKDRLKAKICAPKPPETGDLVRVDAAVAKSHDWPEGDHPYGGKGHWGIFVGRGGRKGHSKVRPLTAGGNVGPALEVPADKVQRADDVVQSEALQIGLEALSQRRKR